jgi:hypothetical protein
MPLSAVSFQIVEEAAARGRHFTGTLTGIASTLQRLRRVLTAEDLAGDVAAAFQHLKTHADIDPKRILDCWE